MSMVRAALVSVVVCVGGVVAQPAEKPAAGPVVAAARAPDFGAVDALAKKWVEGLKLPGAGVLVLRGDGVLHEAYFGEYKADTVVPIASASKWLSGAVIMALVDEKVLDLDKPIGGYMPGLPEDKRKLTIRRLFSHTSGMPSDVASAENWLITMEEAGERLGAAGLLAEPGAEFRYGQAGMQLAAVVACRVTGKAWNDLFEEKVAGPCGMKSTRFGRLGLARNPLVAGGASSTMRDYGNFLAMIAGKGEFKGKRVLSEAAVAEMLKDQTGKAKMVSASLSRMLHSEGYGIGNWVDRKGKGGEPLANSSPGAFGFVPWVDAERGIAGVWMICDRDRMRKDMVKASRLGDVRGEVEKAVDAARGPEPAAKPGR